MSRLLDPKFPTPQDEALRITQPVTVTATAAVGLIDQGAAFGPVAPVGEPMAVTMNIPALKTSAGTETYAVKAQWSDDGVAWTDSTASIPLTAAGARAFGIFVGHRFHQLVVTLGGTAPSITFEAFLNPFVW